MDRMTIAGLAILAGLFTGASLHAQEKGPVPAPVETKKAEPEPIRWREIRDGCEEAAKKQRPMLIFFSVRICMWSDRFERMTLNDDKVATLIRRKMVPVRVQLEWQPELVKALDVELFPTTIVAAHDGKVLGRILGFCSAKDFPERVQDLLAGKWAQPGPKPIYTLKPFQQKVAALIAKHYPKATTTLQDTEAPRSEPESESIHFEYKTRRFMVHEPLKTGEWQDAFPVVGPQPGGIGGSVCLCKGEVVSAAFLPQAFDHFYFTTYRMEPYSKKLDRRLSVTLNYPKDMPKEFFEEFTELMKDFEQHIAVE